MQSNSDYQTVCVVGLGYIGLPTASLLATKGFKVTGVDVRPEVVDTINRGEIHIVEPDLDILVKSAVHSGNLSASLEPVPADVFIIAVPTPFMQGGENHVSHSRGKNTTLKENTALSLALAAPAPNPWRGGG